MGGAASANLAEHEQYEKELVLYRRMQTVYEAKIAGVENPTPEQEVEIWNALRAEFEAAMAGEEDGLAAASAGNDGRIEALFRKIDSNGNGSISVEELRSVFGDAEAPLLLAELDTIDVDGQVQMGEWKAFFENVKAAEGEESMVAALTSLETLVVSQEGEGEADLEVAGMSVPIPDGAVEAEQAAPGTPTTEVLAQDSVSPPTIPAATDASGSSGAPGSEEKEEKEE